jgi:CelD/BcsL family acetyltransferase involved in cellulose biosynthesis
LPPLAEILSVAEGLSHEAAWRDLARRAAEPNPFAEIAFLGPALKHLARQTALRIALVWSEPDRRTLLAALVIERPGFVLSFARVWRHEQAALGAAMFDREAVTPALLSLTTALRSAFPFAAGLLLSRTARDGALAKAARALDGFAETSVLSRAAYNFGGEAEPSAKRRKEWARLERRLAERGRLETRVRVDYDAFERFLALEAKGWKGTRRTALIDAPARAAFAREMAARFRLDGRLRVHELALDDAPIASGLELRAGRRAFFWKISYDEAFAPYSPGVLLSRALARRLAQEGEIELIDSCAAENHPMIDRVWPGRLEFADFALPVGASPLYPTFLAWERAAPRLRQRLKPFVLPLLGRKRS